MKLQKLRMLKNDNIGPGKGNGMGFSMAVKAKIKCTFLPILFQFISSQLLCPINSNAFEIVDVNVPLSINN